MLYCWLYCCRLKFPLRRMWLAVMVLNSSYSFYWDVEQDWDMPWLMKYGEYPCRHSPAFAVSFLPSVPVRAKPQACYTMSIS
jgi:hypothetical protein